MPPYLKWQQKTITNFSDANVNKLYDNGFLFDRTGLGVMHQTRIVRIDLAKFELTSENRRILRKTEELEIAFSHLPYSSYHWSIAKLGTDFYSKKFGEKTFSANKIKELLTEEKSNFNNLLIYRCMEDVLPCGYCISRNTDEFLHYCYPFYNLDSEIPNLGIGMMLKAIVWAKENGKKYVYLGSAQRPKDTYKLQFEGLEWFDGRVWKTDLEELKTILSEAR